MGSDSYDGLSPVYLGGSQGPKLSLNEAERIINNTLQAGDKLLFKRGEEWINTEDNQALHINQAEGTVNQPIIVGAYGAGKTAVIKTNRPNSSVVLVRGHAGGTSHDIIFDSLFITTDLDHGQGTRGLYLNDGIYDKPYNITFRLGQIENLSAGVINYSANFSFLNSTLWHNYNLPDQGFTQGFYSSANHLKVIGNSIQRNGKYGNMFDHCFYVQGSRDVLIEDNHCFNSTDCIKLRIVEDAVIRRNTFSDLMIAAIVAGSDGSADRPLRNVLIEQNRWSDVQNAIAIRSQSGAGGPGSEDITIRNNIIQHTSAGGIGLVVFGPEQIRNLSFYNNLIDSDAEAPAIRIRDNNSLNWNIKNNIIRKSIGQTFNAAFIRGDRDTLSGISFSHNLYFSDPQQGSDHVPLYNLNGESEQTLSDLRAAFPGQERHSLEADPLWFNRAASDFRISAASPAFNAGDTDLMIVYDDYIGTIRPQFNFIDIGPYEVME